MDLLSVREKIGRLRQTSLFNSVSADPLRELAQAAVTVDVPAGTTIVEEGERGTAVYVVIHGLLRAHTNSAGRTSVLGDLNKGSFFGEYGSIHGQLRAATVIAVVDSQVLRIDASAMDAIRIHHPEITDKLQEFIDLRQQMAPPPHPSAAALQEKVRELFPEVQRTALESIGSRFGWLWLPAGSLLFSQEDPGDAAYFLLTGKLQVFTRTTDGVINVLADIVPGGTVGEMALLTGKPRSASVRSLVNCTLLRLSPEDLDRLLVEHPASMERFRSMILERITQQARVEALHRKDARVPVTMEDIEEVVRTRDPEMRNYRITHAYHGLALDVADVIGYDHVNWLAFGAHASFTAGFAIRKEDVPFFGLYRTLRRAPGIDPIMRVAGPVVAASFAGRDIRDILQRTSTAIADGNLRIFAEMAPAMVRFLSCIRTADRFDRRRIDEFLLTLRPGLIEHEGQEVLGQALAAWYEAAHEPDPLRRSQLVFLGNIRMGLHEQQRVQPDIEEALGSPLRWRVGDEIGRAYEKRLAKFPGPIRRPILALIKSYEPFLVEALFKTIKRTITTRMMQIRMPDRHIRLGKDLSTQLKDREQCAELYEVTHPELEVLMDRFQLNAGTTDTTASDWSDFDQRMVYIISLFRMRHGSVTLFNDPLAAQGT